MDKIIAKYVSDYDSGKRDGTGRVFCPFCGEAARERDIEEYAEEGSDRTLELCTNCREGFERNLGLEFESDVLAKPAFSRIWDEAPSQDEDTSGLNENTAEQVAKTFGGEAWQSGGGIWLVMLTRNDGKVVAISEDCICQYASEQAFQNSLAESCIMFR